MWSVCDRSWISWCCQTCRTCPGAHAVSAKLIYMRGVHNYWALSERGWYNILMSGFVVPYFSPGSARVIHPSAGSPIFVHHLSLNPLAHQRVWGTLRTPEM